MACRPHVVCKFFDQYRNLHEELHHSGVGKDQPITIEADFPPTHTASSLGMHMTEIQLQER
jgi:phage terminase small subunit